MGILDVLLTLWTKNNFWGKLQSPKKSQISGRQTLTCKFFPDCLETLQTVRKLSRLSGNFQTVWKMSILSGYFLHCLETFQTSRNCFNCPPPPNPPQPTPHNPTTQPPNHPTTQPTNQPPP